MNNDAIKTLNESKQPMMLKQAAIELAGSVDAADVKALPAFLESGAFLGRLDDEKAYQGTTGSLRLGRVIQALAENRTGATDQVLLKLTTSEVFLGHVLRKQLLIGALAAIKPSPAAAITYWDLRSPPGGALAMSTVRALCVNQSAPAMALLEKKFASAERAVQKVAWLRQIILIHRNDEPILAACERVLNAGEPRGLQVELVEALFDYQPTVWYRGCEFPEPPVRAVASAGSKTILRRIAKAALEKLALPAELAAKVKLALKEIGEREPAK